jgi:hypothetical protein
MDHEVRCFGLDPARIPATVSIESLVNRQPVKLPVNSHSALGAKRKSPEPPLCIPLSSRSGSASKSTTSARRRGGQQTIFGADSQPGPWHLACHPLNLPGPHQLRPPSPSPETTAAVGPCSSLLATTTTAIGIETNQPLIWRIPSRPRPRLEAVPPPSSILTTQRRRCVHQLRSLPLRWQRTMGSQIRTPVRRPRRARSTSRPSSYQLPR